MKCHINPRLIYLSPSNVCASQFRWVYESNKTSDLNRIFSHLPFFVYLVAGLVRADNKEAPGHGRSLVRITLRQSVAHTQWGPSQLTALL